MNVLCIAPYHVTGTLALWKREFARRGIQFRYVTLFRSPYGFEEDICLDLPLQPSSDRFVKARDSLYRLLTGGAPDDAPLAGKPPFQPRPHPLARAFFTLRDAALTRRIESAVERLRMDQADVIWLDQGAEMFRDGRLARRWAEAGIPLMAFYHGSDMRNRGIYPAIDSHLTLRLTSEVDLLYLDDRLEYLFLPIDCEGLRADMPREDRPAMEGEGRLRIGHAARVRANKGSDTIIEVVGRLAADGYPVEMVMIEGVPHAEAMRLKTTCDLFVDQIADAGGWGYGMSGVEALAMGLPTLTRMSREMNDFLPGHPFVHVTGDSLRDELIRLIEDGELRRTIANAGVAWVRRTHDVRAVADRLLRYWEREGWVERGRFRDGDERGGTKSDTLVR